jgi:hypothetical protein
MAVHTKKSHLGAFAGVGFAVSHDLGGTVAVHAFEPPLLMNVRAGPFEDAFIGQHPVARIAEIRDCGRWLVHLMPAFVAGGDPTRAAVTAEAFAVAHLEIEAGMNFGSGGSATQFLVLVGLKGFKGRLAAVEVAGQAAAPASMPKVLFDGS